ncbi:MAG: hypothetical protein AAFQ94_24465 [Bacteroidota bacterium]
MLEEEVPSKEPLVFKNELAPKGRIIHKGIFSPDLRAYYYTLSDEDFSNFDIYVIRFEDEKWSEPEQAFFNTPFNEHGMSFSPDGKSIFFSSTKPVNQEGVSDTWHIWRSDMVNGKWSEPVFVDIPNLRDQLVSHPTVADDGTLYFHVSNPDFSEMDLFYAEYENGQYGEAKKMTFDEIARSGRCTPFIAPDEEYIIYAEIGEYLDLKISYKDENGEWSNTKSLNTVINTFGQGNPFVTPDQRFLFYTTASENEGWQVKWIPLEKAL